MHTTFQDIHFYTPFSELAGIERFKGCARIFVKGRANPKKFLEKHIQAIKYVFMDRPRVLGL
jgi:hypothetical protein